MPAALPPARTSLDRAILLAVAAPALLWGGAAIVAQRIFGLYPCEMCMWQRWPHMAGLALGLMALLLRNNRTAARTLVLLAALAILISGLIGAFHAGVEYKWWQGLTACTAPRDMSAGMLDHVSFGSLHRCDEAPWTLFGISLAGYNALISTGAAILIAALALKKDRV